MPYCLLSSLLRKEAELEFRAWELQHSRATNLTCTLDFSNANIGVETFLMMDIGLYLCRETFVAYFYTDGLGVVFTIQIVSIG